MENNIDFLKSVIKDIQSKISIETNWNERMSQDETPVSIIEYNRYKLTENNSDIERLDVICCEIFEMWTKFKEIEFKNTLIKRSFTGDKFNPEILEDEKPVDVSDEELANEQEETLLSDEEILNTAETSENA